MWPFHGFERFARLSLVATRRGSLPCPPFYFKCHPQAALHCRESDSFLTFHAAGCFRALAADPGAGAQTRTLHSDTCNRSCPVICTLPKYGDHEKKLSVDTILAAFPRPYIACPLPKPFRGLAAEHGGGFAAARRRGWGERWWRSLCSLRWGRACLARMDRNSGTESRTRRIRDMRCSQSLLAGSGWEPTKTPKTFCRE